METNNEEKPVVPPAVPVVPPVTPPTPPPADDPAALKAELDRVKAESTTSAAALKKLQDAEEARKTAAMTEQERIQKERDDARAESAAKDAKLHRAAVLGNVNAVAATAGLNLDSEAVKDLYAAGAFKDIALDDNGDPVGLDAAIKALAKSKPYILKAAKPAAPDINAQNRGDASGKTDEQKREEARKRFRIS